MLARVAEGDIQIIRACRDLTSNTTMAFYKCPKCKKTWQYPIQKCPDCFAILEKMKSEKVKVIGISKVTIPTLFHPKVPYFVLVLEDEKGNKWVQKSIKEYKIGEEFKVKLVEDKNAIAIWRAKYDILEGIEKVIELLAGLKINSGNRILILPTLISPKHPHLAENTSPQFLESIIKYLIENGVKSENIKVAGQSFTDIPIEICAQKSQLLKVCQNFKIMPLDLAKGNFRKINYKGFSFEISEEAFNNNLIINLPILKTGEISATENILKFLKKENYLGAKYLYSEEEIIENSKEVLPNYLTIAEARVIQRIDNLTAFFGVVLAGFNSLNLDRVFFEITYQKDLPEILKKIRIEEIPIVGRELSELQYEVGKYG